MTRKHLPAYSDPCSEGETLRDVGRGRGKKRDAEKGSSLLCLKPFWVFPPETGTHNTWKTWCLITDPKGRPRVSGVGWEGCSRAGRKALAVEAGPAILASPPGSGPPAQQPTPCSLTVGKLCQAWRAWAQGLPKINTDAGTPPRLPGCPGTSAAQRRCHRPGVRSGIAPGRPCDG